MFVPEMFVSESHKSKGFFFQLYDNTPANKRGKYDAIEILAFYIHSLICREVTGREGNGIEW